MISRNENSMLKALENMSFDFNNLSPISDAGLAADEKEIELRFHRNNKFRKAGEQIRGFYKSLFVKKTEEG